MSGKLLFLQRIVPCGGFVCHSLSTERRESLRQRIETSSEKGESDAVAVLAALCGEMASIRYRH